MQFFDKLNEIVKGLPQNSGAFLEKARKEPLLARSFEQDCKNFVKDIQNHSVALLDQYKSVVVNNFIVRKGEESELGVELFVDYSIQHFVKQYPRDISDGELRAELRNIANHLNFEAIHQYQKECEWTWVIDEGFDYVTRVPEVGDLKRTFEQHYLACLSDSGYNHPCGLVKMYTSGGFMIEVTYAKDFVEVSCGFSPLSFAYYSESEQMHWW